MKIQLVPRGNVIPIGDVRGRLIVHSQDIGPSWAIMGIMTYHDHALSGWDAIRIYDRLHGGGTHRLDLIIMESWELDINGYHKKVMESDRFENPALDDSIVEVWWALNFSWPQHQHVMLEVISHPWDQEVDSNTQVWWCPINLCDGRNLRSEKWAGLMIFRFKVFILMPR